MDYAHKQGALEDMGKQVEELANAVVGHRIVSVASSVPEGYGWGPGLRLTLDDGRRVDLTPTSDCCAYSELTEFLVSLDHIDHIITSVETDEQYEKWYILADMHQVLSLDLNWGEGNYPYYSFGFHIQVKHVEEEN